MYVQVPADWVKNVERLSDNVLDREAAPHVRVNRDISVVACGTTGEGHRS